MAISGTSLYVGGFFTSYRGTAFTNIKILKLSTTDGVRDTAYGNPFTIGGYNYSGTVYALHVANSALYAGGDFAGSNGGTAGSTLIKVNLSTGTSTSLYGLTTSPGAVYTIASQSGYLFVGGTMSGWKSGSSLSANYKYLVKVDWNAGVLDTNFNLANNYPNNTVRALSLSSDGNSLFIGGDFTQYRGDAKGSYLAKVNASSGVLDTISSARVRNT